MKKDPQKIADQIIELVSELASFSGASIDKRTAHSHKHAVTKEKDTSGATGGIHLLVEEGKLNSPKQLSEIMEFLRQEGRHYSRPTISMGLLNLVRERVLTRIREKGDNSWKYAIRK